MRQTILERNLRLISLKTIHVETTNLKRNRAVDIITKVEVVSIRNICLNLR